MKRWLRSCVSRSLPAAPCLTSIGATTSFAEGMLRIFDHRPALSYAWHITDDSRTANDDLVTIRPESLARVDTPPRSRRT
ncbi:MAG: hypothetical protein MJB57_14355 [Gemmatimonadetes bacterium]|nr:hypothetical protein [Gemmatimonadota bacterium]